VKRAATILLLLPPLLFGAGAGNQDVNRDGRVDDADVKALARMVAGLDPPDLDFDQDGDFEITLEDVDILLASMATGPAARDSKPILGFTTTRPPAKTPVAGALSFFAIRQRATGQCIVVAGNEGVAPGDTVLGVFPFFQPAQDVITSQCTNSQAQARPEPQQVGVIRESDSLIASPILAVPKLDNDDSTKGIFFISLETGNAFFIDKVKGSPLSVRTRSLNQNVFKALDRRPGQSARHGDILVGSIQKKNGQMHALLLVDTTSGAMSYISELDSRSFEGRLSPIYGKPALGLTSGGGPFALAMWEAPSGKTDGAFLFNGRTGQGIFLEGVGDLDSTLTVKHTPPLPPMPGGLSVMPIHSSDESTANILLIDHTAGSVFNLDLPTRKPWNLEATRLNHNIYAGLPRAAPVQTPHRFVTVPITSSSGATESAIVVDVGTGSMLLLEHLQKASRTTIVGGTRNLYEKLPKEVAKPRVVTAVAKVDSSGATEGAWLFDSVTGNIVFLDGLQNPGGIEIRTVEERAR
jgi:hypothetical protein